MLGNTTKGEQSFMAAEGGQAMKRCCKNFIDHELQNADYDNTNPVFGDQCVSFILKCNKCGKQFHENFMLTNITDPDTDEVLHTH